MLPLMCGSVLSTNVSAQSPPCSMNASPRATWASMSCSRTISDGTVTGGTLSSTLRIGSTCFARPARLLGGRLGQRGVQAGP